MGYKDKMKEGIDATGRFSFADVKAAVEKVANAMGEKAVKVVGANEASGNISLDLFDTGIRRVGNRSLFGAIAAAVTKAADLKAVVAVKALADGKSEVEVGIGEAGTTTTSVVFIPVSTTVHGLTTYRDFLTHFSAELVRLDPGAQVARHGKQ
jgi:hypothetical protein